MKTFKVEFVITTFVRVDGYLESCDIGFLEFYTARTKRGARCLAITDYLRKGDQIKFESVSEIDY